MSIISTHLINMAFLPPTPLSSATTRRFLTSGNTTITPHKYIPSKRNIKQPHIQTIRATQAKPQPPKDFNAPTPRYFVPRLDKLVDIATGSAGAIVRTGSGAFVAGYRIRRENGEIIEYSSTLPTTRPEKPLQLFEFEACPFCRKVREAISILDLDVLVFPCPKDGQVYREYVKEQGGKSQFPYLVDPNTDFAAYESDDIIKYLFRTYGPSDGRVPPIIGPSAILTAGIASQLRSGRGKARVNKIVPAALPIELWGYEPSPFVKLVRETLTELEIPYYLKTTARGSSKRPILKELTGRFQVPYIIDPNTDVAMWECADICDYLSATYGPSASGSVEQVEEGTIFMPGTPFGAELSAAEAVATADEEKSLDPVQEKDDALEKYCETNPDSEECRIYED